MTTMLYNLFHVRFVNYFQFVKLSFALTTIFVRTHARAIRAILSIAEAQQCPLLEQSCCVPHSAYISFENANAGRHMLKRDA